MKPSRLLTLSLLCLPIAGQTQAAGTGNTPRLVVGLYIDQLDNHYLDWFMDGFEEDGFRRLFDKGRVYDCVRYALADGDEASTTASIVCGCPPSVHGIVAGEWLDRRSVNLVSCVEDDRSLGNYTEKGLSPRQLKSPTFGDELKDASPQCKVFSVGITPEGCILSGGRKADGVLWMDPATGQWCTSTYYGPLPKWVENLNDFGYTRDKIEKAVWTPKYPVGRYVYMPHAKRQDLLFRYALSSLSKRSDQASEYRFTPMANSDVIDMAVNFVGRERLGQDDFPDLLNVHLNAGVHRVGSDPRASIETQDLYFRLDEDIARLLQELDRKVGMDKVLVFLTGSGPQRFTPSREENTPGFYPDQSSALLNLYLGALYGSQRWVLGHTANEIYLNRRLIDQEGIDYATLCQQAAIFLGEMEGVRVVHQGYRFQLGETQRQGDPVGDGFDKQRSGDLILTIEEGRNILSENFPGQNRQQRHTQHHTRLVFYGCNLPRETLVEPITLFDIAPVICQWFRIRPPTVWE